MTDKDLCENCAFKNKCEKYRKCLVLQEKLEISVKECQQLKELLGDCKRRLEDAFYTSQDDEWLAKITIEEIDNAIGEKK